MKIIFTVLFLTAAVYISADNAETNTVLDGYIEEALNNNLSLQIKEFDSVIYIGFSVWHLGHFTFSSAILVSSLIECDYAINLLLPI